MAIGDPYGGGLLGNAFGNPLFNFGLGLLSQSGPSLTPQSPWQAIGKAGAYASEAQQQAMQNDLFRSKLAESNASARAQADVQRLITESGYTIPGMTTELSAAVLRADPGVISKVIPQRLTPEAEAMLSAGYPAIAKAQQELKSGEELQQIERVTSDTTIENALEADDILGRLEKGPIAPGSTAASVVKQFADPEGFIPISVPPSTIATAVARTTGKPFTEAQAYQFQTDWNRLNKLSSKFITDQRALSQAQQATPGARSTDFGLSLIQQQNISPYITGNANRLILRDLIKKQKEVAKIRGWDLENIGRGDERLAQWEKLLAPVEPGAATARGYSPEAGITNQPPPSTVISPQPGVPERSSPPPQAAGGSGFFDFLFPGAPAQAGASPEEPVAPPAQAPAPPAPAPARAPKVKGVKTSDFIVNPFDGSSMPVYKSIAAANAAEAELKRKGVTHVLVRDASTGQELILGF